MVKVVGIVKHDSGGIAMIELGKFSLNIERVKKILEKLSVLSKKLSRRENLQLFKRRIPICL